MTRKTKFKKEYYLQILTNSHLKELFDLELITSEVQLDKSRLDGLAYDEKTKSFVIIEYKNKIDFNVLNQGKRYYDLLQDKPEEYIGRYNNKFNVDLKEEDFDFEKTKVMIISPKFSKEQIEKSKNPDYPFELYIATFFECDEETGYITYQKVGEDFSKRLDFNPNDLKITEDKLLEGKSPEMIGLYNNLTEGVLSQYSDVKVKPMVNQFSFRANDKLLCTVVFQKSSFSIFIYAESLKNAERTVDISQKSTGGAAKYNLKYESNEDFDYFMDLFKQTYTEKVMK